MTIILFISGCVTKTYITKHDKNNNTLDKEINQTPINSVIPQVTNVDDTVEEHEKKLISPPNNFKLRVEIEDYKVTNMELLDGMEYTLGQVRQVGKYLSVDRVMIKLVADNFPSNYWLAYLPHEKDLNNGYGIKTIYAGLNDDDIISKYQDLNTPPNNIKLHVWFENGKTIRNEFEKFRPWWGRFYFFERNRQKQIDRFKNDTYPSKIWEAMYPKNANGKYILTLELME